MRLERHTLSRFVVLSALGLILATAASARASSIVSVTGGFTGFNGLASGTAAGCDTFFRTFVAGALVNAPSCTGGPEPGGIFLYGSATSTFAMVSSLEFYEQQFNNQAPPNGPFADLAHNGFGYSPAISVPVSDVSSEFYLGSLAFTNGVWFGTGSVNRFHIELTTSSSDPAFDNKTLSDDLVLDIATGNTPRENMDCFAFSHFNIGVLCAFEPGVPGETNTVRADIFGHIGSLIPTRFANVTGGLLVPPTTTAVPEPSSLILLGTGLAAIVRRRRRAR